MASPTFAEAMTQIANILHIPEEHLKWLNSNATNYQDLEDTLVTSLETDFAPEITAALSSIRTTESAVIDLAAGMLAPALRTVAKVIGSNRTDIDGILDDLYDYMIDNSQSVNSRAISYGSASAGGSNVGDGTFYRVTADENGENIENIAAISGGITWEAKCTEDENSGTRPGEESFLVRYQSGSKDNVDFAASSDEASISIINPDNGVGIENPSFNEFSGTISALTDLPGWTATTSLATNFELDQTNYYVASPVERVGTPASLEIKGNDTITQKLSDNDLSLDSNTPYLAVIYYNRQVNSGDGTLTVSVGAQSNNVVLAAQTGWNALTIPSTVGQNSWFKNLNEADLDITIALSGNTTGSVLVDHFIFAPMQFFANQWFAITQGATNFQRDDIFTVSDSITTDGVLQYWFWRLTGRFLPHNNAGGETIADP